MIASVDDNVGRLLDYLDREGLAENTIVIYTSDNGFFLGDHGWFDKRFMYEESLHIPLCDPLSRPHQAGLGERRAGPQHRLRRDVPRLRRREGPRPRCRADHCAPSWRAATPIDWRKSIYYHYYEFPQPHRVHPHYGVRTQKHKLIYFYTLNEWELFDLEKDPHELKNVYDDPGYAQVRREMTAELGRLRSQFKDTTMRPARGGGRRRALSIWQYCPERVVLRNVLGLVPGMCYGRTRTAGRCRNR